MIFARSASDVIVGNWAKENREEKVVRIFCALLSVISWDLEWWMRGIHVLHEMNLRRTRIA